MEKKSFDILAEIRQKFPKRIKKNGNRFSPEFKRMVLSAIRSGKRACEVAEASGVSKQTVSNWLRSPAGDFGKAVELQLIDRPTVEPIPAAIAATARLHLRSGAVLEFPLSALDERLLALLGRAP